MDGTTMQAIVQTGSQSIEVREMERPSIAADQVLVRVHAAGLCGSDAHAYLYDGGYEWVAIPRIMGHEYAGTVAAVGEDVADFEVGDAVVEEVVRNCGRCFQCRNGQANVCQSFSVKGMHRDGAYAEYTVADTEKLHRVPSSVPLRHAALTEPLSIATRAVFSRADVSPADTVLVEGPGPIGTFLAVVLASTGARVLVSGLGSDAAYRLPLLDRMGIETVNLDERSLVESRDEVTDGVGFDVVFDATGHRSGLETAVEQVRKGGSIVVVGLPGGPSEVPVADVVRNEVRIDTSYGSNWRNFEQALQLLASGLLDPDEIIDDSPSIEDPEPAFEAFLAGKTCKPLFAFDSP